MTKSLSMAIGAGTILLLASCQKFDHLPGLDLPKKGKKPTEKFAFVSSNTGSTIGAFPIGSALKKPGSVTGMDSRMIRVPYADADGIVYDQNRDVLYHVNRTDKMLVAYKDVKSLLKMERGMDGYISASPSAMGPASFTSGREATMYENKVVVADDLDAGGKLASYHVNSSTISDFRNQAVGIQLWGIQAVGKDLFAVVDASNQLAWYQDYFMAKSGPLSASVTVSIEGLVRTHGLHYDEASDIMVLTDIGLATSADDGGLIVIRNFRHKFSQAAKGSGSIKMKDQIRVYGNMTMLGNPVDVDICPDTQAIVVAERAAGGGQLLIFAMPGKSGNFAPAVAVPFAGASAVTLND